MSDHVGPGPDGGNLLGFLAAVGTLGVLADVWPDREVRMSWTYRDAWRPVWRVCGETSEEEIVAALHSALRVRASAPEFTHLGSNINVSPEDFATFARSAATQATSQDRRWADYVVAFGCEAVSAGKQIQDTALRTMSGAGHQDFLGFFRKLIETTSEAHIRAALFAPWTYEDEGPSMRWDPIDDRRYAYRADDPAKSKMYPIRTMRGANRLAIEALPMFPTAPRGKRLYTTGFITEKGDRVIRWPIWEGFASGSTVRSLISHPEVVEVEPRWDKLRGLGVVEVYSSRRRTEGRFRNFAPAEPLLGRAGQ